MHPFTFVAASDELSAIRAARAPDAMYVAGGTTLIDLMKLGVERPAVVVDISSLPWTTIETLPDGGLRIGALARNADMAQHELIRSRYPMLAQALLAGASPQLRNMATCGGNLLQRTRCTYFRDEAAACNKRTPGAGCAALEGYNRSHAILGTSDHCIATHPSDMSVALAALDATVRVSGPTGSHVIPFHAFHLLPGDHPERESPLGPGDLVTAIDIPDVPFATRSVYVKVRDRASYAFALASAAVALDLAGGRIREARIALGGVATVPWRARAAEQVLAGAIAGRSAYEAAADAALETAVPRHHNAFKLTLARRTIIRALMRAEALP